jgi:hypothetical protein
MESASNVAAIASHACKFILSDDFTMNESLDPVPAHGCDHSAGHHHRHVTGMVTGNDARPACPHGGTQRVHWQSWRRRRKAGELRTGSAERLKNPLTARNASFLPPMIQQTRFPFNLKWNLDGLADAVIGGVC